MHCNLIVMFMYFHLYIFILQNGQHIWNSILYNPVHNFITCTPIMPLGFN